MKQSNIRAQLFVLMAAILWGTTGSAQAFAPNNANPIVIGAMRMSIGGTVLFFIAAMKGSFKDVKLNRKLLLIASICMAVYQPLFFSGVSKTGVALGTVLALGSAPIFSGGIEYILGQKLNRRWIIATGVSIIGCTFLFNGQDSMNMNVFGSVLSLGAGLSYAIYATVARKLFQDSQRDAVNGLVFLISAIMLSPILFMNDLSWVVTTSGLLTVLHLGIVATALAYSLFAYGLVNVPTSKAVTLTLAEPLTAAMLGVLVFDEKLTSVSMIGVLFLFFGLIINSYPDKTISNQNQEDL